MESHEQDRKREHYDSFIHFWESHSAIAVKETNAEHAYRVSIHGEKAEVTMRVLIEEEPGTATITNMTVLPDAEKGRGFGTRAVAMLFAWAKESGLHKIIATQVQEQSEKFWQKNGFAKAEGPNPLNDFTYTI